MRPGNVIQGWCLSLCLLGVFGCFSKDKDAVDTGGGHPCVETDTGTQDTGELDTDVADTGGADTGVDTGGVDTGVDTGGEDTGSDDTGSPVAEDAMPDCTLVDINPNSPTYNQSVSTRDYLQKTSGWYFMHAT